MGQPCIFLLHLSQPPYSTNIWFYLLRYWFQGHAIMFGIHSRIRWDWLHLPGNIFTKLAYLIMLFIWTPASTTMNILLIWHNAGKIHVSKINPVVFYVNIEHEKFELHCKPNTQCFPIQAKLHIYSKRMDRISLFFHVIRSSEGLHW